MSILNDLHFENLNINFQKMGFFESFKNYSKDSSNNRNIKINRIFCTKFIGTGRNT